MYLHPLVANKLHVKNPRDEPQQAEAIFAEITLHKNFKVTVGCVYRPPNSGSDFWSQQQQITEPFVGRRLILLGDFNVDVPNPLDLNYPHLQSICSLHSLVNHVGSPTRERLSATASKCIDLILGNFCELSSATVRHVDLQIMPSYPAL